MQLLTKQLREPLPPLSSQEHVEDPMVSVKFFTPDAGFSWYATEGSPVDANGIMIKEGETTPEADFLFFGVVLGIEAELGYFSLSQLRQLRGPWGLPIERDLYFTPCRLTEVISGERR
jgi:Protein of unknown function (DUF2958)